MGIPGFNFWLTKIKAIKFKIGTQEIFDKVLVDLNSFIYDAGEKLGKNSTDDGIIAEVILELQSLIMTTSANKYIFVLDGVPTLAKINQQRQRRFKTKKYGDWDTINISPYSKFMDKLAEEILLAFDPMIMANKIIDGINKKFGTELRHFYLTRSEYLSPIRRKFGENSEQYKYASDMMKKIELIDHNVPGEGEHKIIKILEESITTKHYLIISKDADISVLCLPLSQKNIHIRKHGDIETYEYVSMVYLESYLAKKGVSSYDFILMTYLIGNDFIPKTPDFHNVEESLNLMIDLYKECKFAGEAIIGSDTKKEIITKRVFLSKKYYDYLKKHKITDPQKKFKLRKPRLEKRSDSKLPSFHELVNETIDKRSFSINPKKLVKFFDKLADNESSFFEFRTKKEVSLTNVAFKKKGNKQYFFSALYSELTKMSYTEGIYDPTKLMVEDYFKGLVWFLNFYIKGKGTDWYYKYNYAPMFIDVADYVRKLKGQDYNDLIKETLSSEIRLTKKQHLVCIGNLGHLKTFLKEREFEMIERMMSYHYPMEMYEDLDDVRYEGNYIMSLIPINDLKKIN